MPTSRARATNAPASRPHPYTIKFFSAASPRGCYFLKVGFVIGQRAYFPTLQVEINGQQGWAYHHPQRHDAPGDKYWSDELEIQLPTPSLKQGDNTLVLTAIDEAGSDANSAGLEYDALELDQDTGQAYDPRKIGIQFEPSIYYQTKGKQLLRACGCLPAPQFSSPRRTVRSRARWPKLFCSYRFPTEFWRGAPSALLAGVRGRYEGGSYT